MLFNINYWCDWCGRIVDKPNASRWHINKEGKYKGGMVLRCENGHNMMMINEGEIFIISVNEGNINLKDTVIGEYINYDGNYKGLTISDRLHGHWWIKFDYTNEI